MAAARTDSGELATRSKMRRFLSVQSFHRVHATTLDLIHNAKPPSPEHIGGYWVSSCLNLRFSPHFLSKGALGQAVENRFSCVVASRTDINDRWDSPIEASTNWETVLEGLP
ncbi:hypothetical protein PIB30_003967 [Stylosanthes scabra]|uniref:Uncharacterized protein n=1 Tax=Stylosanthes scabra TaxID=79078 RepID=A0ABU6W1K4_9FABA|nr:hypothetical protein [Stylosanthes scabra]